MNEPVDHGAKPLASRARRSLDAIVAAATDQFLDRGFDRVSMADIALGAGVSKQTVYAHFRSKEALFLAVVQTATGSGTDEVQSGTAFPPRRGPEAELLDFAERQLRVVSDPRLLKLRRLVATEAPQFPELGRALHAQGPARAIAGLERLLSFFAEHGQLKISDAAHDAALFNWLLMGGPVNSALFLGDDTFPRGAAAKDHARKVVALFFAARSP